MQSFNFPNKLWRKNGTPPPFHQRDSIGGEGLRRPDLLRPHLWKREELRPTLGLCDPSPSPHKDVTGALQGPGSGKEG